MGKNQSASNLTNIIRQDASGNITFLSGSKTLAVMSNTGQVSGSVPALSASYAATSSYATNFNVSGTITATTLVVQTITSSVDYVTGSTRFGSLSSNTHTFTGSMNVTGSGTFTGTLNTTGYLQINASANNSFVTTNSTSSVIGFVANSSIVDQVPRIELTGTGYPSTPSIAYIRANTVVFTLNSAGTETMRITSAGNVGIRSNSPRATLHVQQATNDGTPSLGTARDGAVFTSNNGNYGLNITIDPSGDTLMQAMRFDGSATAYALKLQPAGGAVVTPNQPLVMGAMAGDQSVSATTFTTIAFNTNYGFNQANIGSCWNNSSNAFTAPQTGVYLINAALYTSNVGQIAAFINGTRTISMVANGATMPTTWHGTIMIKMNASDVLTLRGYGDGSGTVYQNTYHTWFGIYFLG